MQITASYLHEVVQVEHWNSFTEGFEEQSPQPSHSHSEAPVQLPPVIPFFTPQFSPHAITTYLESKIQSSSNFKAALQAIRT